MALVALLFTMPAAAQPLGPIEPKDGGLIDLPMLRDPELAEVPKRTEYDPRYEAMWLLAIDRPEYDLRLDAIKSFTEVREGGMEGLDDVVPVLVDRLANDENIKVRLAAAEALVAFEAQNSAEAMLEAGRDPRNVGAGMVLTVDPALAEWDYVPARDVWLQRLDQIDTDPTRAASAMRSLAIVGEPRAVEPLRQVATDRNRDVASRLEAGRALGAIAAEGLIEDAQSLAGGEVLDRQIAVDMLASHDDADAADLLQQLAGDPDPSVAGRALAVLNTFDSARVVTMAPELAEHDDANVRRAVVVALATDPSDPSIALLGALLDDPSVAVRNLARQTLVDFDGQDGMREAVRTELRSALARDGWRGLEQAALLANILDDKPSAGPLAALLDHERPEVRLASASALRGLAVPETLPAMLERAEAITEAVPDATTAEKAAFGRETTQLFTAFGQMEYAPAEPLMKRYIPKNSGFDPNARGAAVYALGKLHAGETDSEYVAAFRSRLSDINPMDPEASIVRRFSAVGLGRMNAASALAVLQQFEEQERSSVDIGAASRWAIEQITGEAVPQPETIVLRPRDFFLVPLDD